VVTPVTFDGLTVLLGDISPREVPRLLGKIELSDRTGQALSSAQLHARTYDGTLAGHAAQRVTVLLVPSSAGISAAVCLGDTRRNASVPSDCASALTTGVALRGATPLAASPERADASRLREVVRALNVARRRDAAVLGTASTGGRQANAARSLSADYARAARDLRAVPPTTLAAPALRKARRATADARDAYAALGRSANVGAPGGYDDARSDAHAAESLLRDALAELTLLGYAGR
jgi:hypothetical protein